MKRAIDVAPFGELADPRVLAELAIAAEDRGWGGVAAPAAGTAGAAVAGPVPHGPARP